MREDSANEIIMIRHIYAPIFGAFFVPENWQSILSESPKIRQKQCPERGVYAKIYETGLGIGRSV